MPVKRKNKKEATMEVCDPDGVCVIKEDEEELVIEKDEEGLEIEEGEEICPPGGSLPCAPASSPCLIDELKIVTDEPEKITSRHGQLPAPKVERINLEKEEESNFPMERGLEEAKPFDIPKEIISAAYGALKKESPTFEKDKIGCNRCPI